MSRPLALLTLLGLVACAPPAASPVSLSPPACDPAARLPEQLFTAAAARRADPSRLARLQAALPGFEKDVSAEVDKLGVPGLAAGLVADGRLVWSRGYGVRDLSSKAPVTADTVFRIGSVTKTFTGLALLLLRDEGRLGLDDPAVKYLPELGGLRYTTRDSPVFTLRNLTTHTSGLTRHGPLGKLNKPGHGATEAELFREMAGMKLEQVPGLDDQYSNLGASLEGLVVGRVAKLRYRDFVTQRLLAPLGMTSSVWEPHAVQDRLAVGHAKKDGIHVVQAHEDLGIADAAGGLYSTVPDLARYVAFQLSAWPPRDDPDKGPVRRSTVRESHRIAGPELPSDHGFGVHWVLTSDCDAGFIVDHNGSVEGFKSAVYFLPGSDVGVILLANANDPDLDGVARRLLRRLTAGTEKLSPVLEEKLVTLQALMVNPDPKVIAETFTPEFFKAVGGVDQVQSFLEGVGKDAGACKAYRPRRVEGDRRGEVVLPCEKRWLKVSISVTASEPRRVSGFSVLHTGKCDP